MCYIEFETDCHKFNCHCDEKFMNLLDELLDTYPELNQMTLNVLFEYHSYEMRRIYLLSQIDTLRRVTYIIEQLNNIMNGLDLTEFDKVL